MNRLFCVGLALAVTACDSIDDSAPGVPGDNKGAPVSNVGGDVSSARYDAGTNSVIVTSLPFDDGSFAGSYSRAPAFDTNGFQAYRNTAGLRDYLILWKTSASADLSAGVVNTPQYRGYGFGGYALARAGNVATPTSGLATYSGDYAGLRVFNGRGGLQRTEGDLVLDVDFADATIEGAITNRSIVDTGAALETVIFATGSIEDGAFDGSASSVDGATGSVLDSGTYQGLFGNGDGSEVIGILLIERTDTGGIGVQETGVFSGTRN